LKKVNESQYLWPEKYAPKIIQDMIIPDEIKRQFQTYIEDENIPNILIYGNQPGIGKSSIVNAIIDEMESDTKRLNGSGEGRGIDVFNDEIPMFATSYVGKKKIVFIDECLEENQEVLLGTTENPISTKLSDMGQHTKYKCISYNIDSKELENDTCEIISDKYENVFEVELEDGRKIELTETHPFIVKDKNGKISKRSIKDGLDGYEIIDFYKSDISLDDEDYKDVTVKFRKTQADILEKSGVNLEHLLRGFLETTINTLGYVD